MGQQIENDKNPPYAQVSKKALIDEKSPKATRNMNTVREFGEEEDVLAEHGASKHPACPSTTTPPWLSLGDGRRLFADGTVTDKDDNILALPIEDVEEYLCQSRGWDTWVPE